MVAEPRYLSGDSDFLFGQDQLHTFEIDVPQDALARIDASPAAEEYVEATLAFAGENVGAIGVRYKGSVGGFVGCTDSPNPLVPTGEKTCTKLSMQLKINWTDPDAQFYGVRKVQLHSQNLDPTMMHERLGYWLFAAMGVPVPRSTHARVMVNGEYQGLFALTEEIDGRFARYHFDDGTGNLYKEVWPFDVAGLPNDPDLLIASLHTNEDENPTTAIISEFATDLVGADDGAELDTLTRWLDVEMLLTTFVVDRAIRNDDGPLHWYCFGPCAPHNFYWYEDPSARQVTLIPWDLDNAFDNLGTGSFTGAVTNIADPWAEITSDCDPFPFGMLNLLQRSAACDPLIGALSSLDAEYDRIRAELIAGPMSEDSVQALIAEWSAQVEAAVEEAAALHADAPSVAEWRAAMAKLVSDINATRAGAGR